MEEDSGVKAPVTRLRRRLSVEQSDPSTTKSPAAPLTPTKKRAGRLAAKPQLDLIDENVPQNSPKRATRKSIARDIVEEEKPVTPSRRNTRIRSNTSILAETQTQSLDSPRAKRAAARRTSQVGSDNEAPVTPARTRRTRKDSTSSVDKASPASDTLSTPGRTRRTRKDSTSSIDKQAEIAPSAIITEVISEEPENSLRKSTGNEVSGISEDKDTSPSIRKSPRLAKKDRRSNSSKSDGDNDENISQSNENIDQTKSSSPEDHTSKENMDVTESGDVKDKLSLSSSNLINDMETKPKKSKKNNINKSMSTLKDSDDSKRRQRTKSWSNLSMSQSNEHNFYSDNESTKKKIKKNENLKKRLSDQAGSGDSLQKTIKDYESNDNNDEQEISVITGKSSKKQKRCSETSFTDEINTSVKEALTLNKSSNLNKSAFKAADISNESNKENLHGVNPKHADSSVTELLFAKTPSDTIKSMVFIEDSDTDSVGKGKVKLSEKEDQCVPVVEHKLVNQDSPKLLDQNISNLTVQNQIFNAFVEENMRSNDSCEPMDIDETMPENVSLTDLSKESNEETTSSKQSRKSSLSVSQVSEVKANESDNKSKRKSSMSNSLSHSLNTSSTENGKIDESSNKSKRKSSVSNSVTQSFDISQTAEENVNHNVGNSKRKSSLSHSSNISQGADKKNESANKSKRKSSSNSITQDLDKTENENKSTLILSQIKDVSSTENNASKSIHTEILSKSMDVPDCGKDNIVKNKNISLNYLTSTPVHQKDVNKLGIQINTSVITPSSDSKKELRASKNMSKKDVSSLSEASKKTDSSEDDEEDDSSSHDKSNLLDDEAEDAGDDYESGDSQDDDEMQYERENEIVERGETLTSEDEISNDSDYDKDSFIVSDDEEDNELLSGSGDDLEMSVNELTMSAKSKKKFNERKLKEQKKASREMFEARHKLNESNKSAKKDKSIKSSRSSLDSSLLESDEDAKLPPKKKGRLRLDSSMAKSEEEVESNNKNASSVSEPEEIGYKKKKSKRLSESVCNESAINENEITVCNEGNIENNDPLSILVKQEPKTPQQSLNISTVHFTSRDEIEQIHVDENASMMKPNESLDPLQATMAQSDDEDSDSGSISENEEIAKNYDTMLNELNKDNKSKPIKSGDISLNLNKKSKNKMEPIIEQLNLTQTKKSKKNDVGKTKQRPVTSVNASNDEASSDSIDLKLLFSDDSNGSEQNCDRGKKPNEEAEIFIPLKRTEAKTNIRDVVETNNSLLDTSSKKKKSRKSSLVVADAITNNEEETPHFFVDTTGTNDLHASVNTTLNSNSKKMKNKKNSICLADNELNDEREDATLFFMDTTGTRADLDTSKSVSLNTSSIKKKKKKNSISFAEESGKSNDTNKDDSVIFFVDTAGVKPDPDDKNTSLNTSQKKKNKKNSISFVEEPLFDANADYSNDAPTETSYRSEKNKEATVKSTTSEIEMARKSSDTSVMKTPKSEKIKKKKLSESHSDDVTDSVIQNVSLNSSKLKEDTGSGIFEKDEKFVVVTEESNSKKRKRKSSANMSFEVLTESSSKTQKEPESLNETTLNVSKKKKRKISQNSGNITITENCAVPSSQTTITQELDTNKSKYKRSNAQDNKVGTTSQPVVEKKVSKRKRDEDDVGKKTKVLKENSLDKIHVSRLPAAVLHQLEDKPNKEVLEIRKANITSTTDFMVEETVRRKNKPSNYLEESICLNNNESPEVKKQKTKIKKPKLLPFIPTASTSDSGFTTKFQVNVLPKKIEFVAQKSEVPNFKNDYLNKNKVKRLRTYELYKNHRSVKLSKY